MRNRAGEHPPITLTGNETPEQLNRLGIYRSGLVRLLVLPDDRFVLQYFRDMGGRWVTRDQGPLLWKPDGLLLVSRKQIPYGQVFFTDSTELQAVKDNEFFYGPYLLSKLSYPKVMVCTSVQANNNDFSNSLTLQKIYMVDDEPKPGELRVRNNQGRLRRYPKELFGEF